MENKLIIIKDNFLDKKSFATLKSTIFSCMFDTGNKSRDNHFPWFLQDSKVDKGDNHIQLTHIFYHNFAINSAYFNILKPFLKKLKVRALYRIKANVTMKSAKDIFPYGYHTDQNILKDRPCGKTGVFYLHTTNGPTSFKEGQKVDCVENRMVIFPADMEHSGCTHTDNLLRGVINFNWF